MTTEDLIWEIIVHLPTKSLMRFKCVSKLWYSIIRNLKFAIAHGGGTGGCFRGLLILDIFYKYHFIKAEINYSIIRNLKFFYVNLNDNCPKLTQHQLTIQEQEYTNVTQVVKGLIGLYKDGTNKFTLCNIATHQFLKLPNLPSPMADSYSECYYSLGFDVVNQVFKVLNIFFCCDWENNYEFTHVFTLGVNNNSDMNWRKINHPASLDLYFQSDQCLCIDGVLYWMPLEGMQNQPIMTAFHLNNETFETIAIPESTRTRGGAHLVEICGRPGLVGVEVTTHYTGMLDVWTMNNDWRGGSALEAWTRKRVVFPTSFDIASSLNYAATLPTGEMMLSYRESDNSPLHIYIYDHRKNEFNSITVEGYKSQQSGMKFEERKICYYEENIISLDFLMSNEKLEDKTINSS